MTPEKMLPVGFLTAVRKEFEAEHEQVLLRASPCEKEKESRCPFEPYSYFRLCPDTLADPPFPSNLAGKGGQPVAPQRDEQLGPLCYLQPSEGLLPCQKAL